MKLFESKLESTNYLVAQFQPIKRTIVIDHCKFPYQAQIQLPIHEFWFPKLLLDNSLQIFQKFSIRFFCRKDNHLYVPPLPNIITKCDRFTSGSFCLTNGNFTDRPKSAIIKTIDEFWFSSFRGSVNCELDLAKVVIATNNLRKWIETSENNICDFSNFYSYMESPELFEYEIPG